MRPKSLKIDDLDGYSLLLRVKITRSLRFRMFIAKLLFRLGARVICCKLDFE